MTTTAERGPSLRTELVQEFVVKGHGDLAGVEALLDQEPNLVNAAHDWGDGDWETALGGAAHMGRRDIATLLLNHGARIDLFAAAMLGHLSIVQSILSEYPEMRNARGPHGIPLEMHARAGGAEAESVLKYIQQSKS